MKKRCIVSLLTSMIALHPAYAFEAFTVEQIEINGLERISEGTVYNYLPLDVGERLAEDQTGTIITSLYKTGFFEDIKLSVQDSKLVINLKERPAIGQIRFEGNEEIKDSDLQDALKQSGLAEGHTYKESDLELIRGELERMYYSQGRYGVKVETTVSQQPRNRVKIKIEIDEGHLARIQSINIVGNTEFSDKTLVKAFSLSTKNIISWITKKDRYSKLQLNQDLETLRTFYLDRGYLDFQITSTQVSISPDRKDIYITINVEEGMPYVLTGYTLSGNLILTEEELLEPIRMPIGKAFSRKAVSDVVKYLTDRLGEEGYAFAKVNPVPELNQDTHEASLTFYVDPGQKIFVNRISFTGNNKSKDEVLRREVVQMERSWANTKRIEHSKTRLNRTGFFTDVKSEIKLAPGYTDMVDVLFKVDEASSGEIGGSVGYSDKDGLLFNANVKNSNFFGSGKAIDLNFNKSQAYTTYSFGYTDPYFTLDGISVGYNLFYSQKDLSNTTNLSEFSTNVYGANVNFGVPISEYQRLSLGFGYQNTYLETPKDKNFIPTQINDFIANHGEKYDELSVALGWNYNSFDRRIFPEKGWRHSLNATATAPVSSLKYYRLNYVAQWYTPLFKGFVFSALGNVGFGGGYGNTGRLPFYKHFYAGGSNTVRGYKESSLGPRDSQDKPFGGNFMGTGSLRLVLPNFIAKETNSVRLSLFAEGGQVYDFARSTGSNPRGLRYSAGVSVTWMSPMAPIVLSFAIPLNPEGEDDTQRGSFSLGTVF